jgi:hypothetical protein
MTALHEIQAAFGRALLDGDMRGIATHIAADGFAPEERLGVHRNNMMVSLTDVLRDTFPAVCRLVDERFFAYAAHEFILEHPPERPCLFDYGARFADFLAAFPPCRDLVYLPDVARLEWLMNVAAHAADAEALMPAALAGVAMADTPRLLLRLHPALGYLASPWPVEQVWRANRRDAAGEGAIDLAAGGVGLEVGRQSAQVVMCRLDPAPFVFRVSLAVGETLATALESALAADDRFDVASAISELFRHGAVVGFALASPDTETTS